MELSAVVGKIQNGSHSSLTREKGTKIGHHISLRIRQYFFKGAYYLFATYCTPHSSLHIIEGPFIRMLGFSEFQILFYSFSYLHTYPFRWNRALSKNRRLRSIFLLCTMGRSGSGQHVCTCKQSVTASCDAQVECVDTGKAMYQEGHAGFCEEKLVMTKPL